MSALFQIKIVPWSDTVYSEAYSNLEEAQTMGDWRWYGDVCIEAHSLLVEAGVLTEGQPVSVTQFPELLRHCHIDAQIPEEEEN